MRKLVSSIIFAFSVFILGVAQSQAYDYPLSDPFVATVVGTPNAYKADLPPDIPTKNLELVVFEEREAPDVLWHSQALRYSLVRQDHPAPLIFVIAGTGAGYNSPKMQMLQRAFYQAGFHVLSLSSPTHPNFMVSASTTGVPGHFMEDAQDLYRVMVLAWLQIQKEIEVTEFYLTGYSLGAAQAAFVAQLDEGRGTFQFEKALLINPPVSLYTSALILDEMLTQNLSDDPESVHQFFDQTFQTFSEVYQTGDFLNFGSELLYAACKQKSPSQEKIAALIGIDFRMSSASMVFTSDVLINAGYIKPKDLKLSSTDTLTDYYKVSVRVSFREYFEDLFSPYFQRRYPGLNERMLIRNLSLRSIEPYLRRATELAVVHNADDLILGPGELSYLQDVFGTRAKVYPKGGHCGNIDHRDNVAYMVNFFQGQTGSATSSDPGPLVHPVNKTTNSKNHNLHESMELAHFVSTPSSVITSEPVLNQHIERNRLRSQTAEHIASPIEQEELYFESIKPGRSLGNQTSENRNLLVQEDNAPHSNRSLTNEPQKPVSKIVKSDARYAIDIYDPWEGFNRTMYNFNAQLDDYVFLPVVSGYEAVMPDYVEDRISNFFSNIDDIRNLLNALLQLKPEVTLRTAGRFLVNSTVGLGGLWDHATGWGLPQQTEDFGQTLGHYGVGNGQYVVLPIFGPSNLRDTSGFAVDKVAQYFYLYVPVNLNNTPEFGLPYSFMNSIDSRHKISFRYKARQLEIEK